MMRNLVIAQISDIHISPIESSVYGSDMRNNFLMVLDDIQKLKQIDLIVLSGDLAFREGDDGIYQWIKSKIAKLKIPYQVMPGNHDDILKIAKVFDLHNLHKDGFIYHDLTIKGKKLIFLDSSTDLVPTKQLHWLKRKCNSYSHEIILFIHHPPAYCGCRYMDTNFPLRNMEATQQVLKGCTNIKKIFAGHYHTQKTVRFQDKTIFITPSTWFQINEKNSKFTIKSKTPAWRLIRWDEQGISSVVRKINLKSEQD